MRFVGMGLVALAVAGCGAKYKPGGPVLADYERAFKYPVNRPHADLIYNGRSPATPAPIVPMMAFGAAFDLDFAVMPKDGDFQMLEYARIAMPDRPVWVALETNRDSGEQTLLANMDDIWTFMPEIPLRRQSVSLQAEDRSTEFTADLSLSYTNSRGQQVTAEFTGDTPLKPAKNRNGRTFDHSQNQLMAVLDIPASESLFKANVRIDDKGVKLAKIAGIVPAQFVLTQTQGGLAIGNYRVVPGDTAAGGDGFGDVIVHAAGTASAEIVAKPPPEMQARMTVAKNFATIETCWKTRADQKTDLKGGRMQFSWNVTGGAVSEAKADTIEREDAFVDDALAKCVVDAIGKWTFDAEVTGSMSWPFTFMPGDEESDPGVRIEEGAAEIAEAPAPAPEAPAPDAPAPDAPGDDLPDDPGAAAEPASSGGAAMSSFTTVHTQPDGTTVEMRWLVSRQGDRVLARQSSDLRTLEYEYRLVQDNYLELVAITVEQYGRGTPVTSITFNPPIPDLRWPFSGKRVSGFVVDVNGQQNLAYGEAEAYWVESGPKLKVTPAEPEWVADRPLLSTITFSQDGTAEIRVERTGE